MNRSVLILSLLMSCAMVHGAGAESFMLLDRDGVVSPVQLTVIGPGEVEIMDSRSGFSVLPRSDCIAFLRPTPTPINTRKPMLRLHDGQVLPGQLVKVWEDDHVLWEHDWLGPLRVPMDRIDRITMRSLQAPVGTTIPRPPSDLDVVRLLNGDAVEGFVTSISDPVVIEIDQEQDTVESSIPLDRVQEIDLFGEPEPMRDPRVWTMDGTVATLSVLELTEDSYLRIGDHEFRIEGDATELSGPGLRRVHAMSLSGSIITSLSNLVPLTTSVPQTRLQAAKPLVTDRSAPLGLSPVELRGPISIEYALPAGPHRFYSTVRLPASSEQWGDCELVLLVDGVQVHRSRFNSGHTVLQLDIPIEGDMLELRILEGDNGPVQDHLRFEYALLLPD